MRSKITAALAFAGLLMMAIPLTASANDQATCMHKPGWGYSKPSLYRNWRQLHCGGRYGYNRNPLQNYLGGGLLPFAPAYNQAAPGYGYGQYAPAYNQYGPYVNRGDDDDDYNGGGYGWGAQRGANWNGGGWYNHRGHFHGGNYRYKRHPGRGGWHHDDR
jgi:hypothetical protein